MAILFDAVISGTLTTSGGAGTTSALTIGNNSGRATFLTVYSFAGLTVPSSVTVGGVAATQIYNSPNQSMSVWVAYGVPTGSKTASIAGAGNGIWIYDLRTYYNVKQSSQPDNTAETHQNTGALNLSTPITPNSTNALVLGIFSWPFSTVNTPTYGGFANNQTLNTGTSSGAITVGDGGVTSTIATITAAFAGSVSTNTCQLTAITLIHTESFTVLDTITPSDPVHSAIRAATFTKIDTMTLSDHLGVFARAATFTVLNSISLIDGLTSIVQKWQRQSKNISVETNVSKSANPTWTDSTKHISSETNQTKN